jgi:hypothetical protein
VVESPSPVALTESPSSVSVESSSPVLESSSSDPIPVIPEKAHHEESVAAVSEVGQVDSPRNDVQSPPETEKAGFFKRIFGRFGK